MRLWITRDNTNTKRVLIIASDEHPLYDSKMWYVADGANATIMIIDGKDTSIPPGTCTELFTEQQVRAMANHLLFACDESVKAYCCEMSDENWSRLMAEVGAGGAS